MGAKRKTSKTPRHVPPKKRAGAPKPKSQKKPYKIIERTGGRGAAEPKGGTKRRGVTKGGRIWEGAAPAAPSKGTARKTERIQLRWIAQARSGDKGDIANVALFAPTPETYEVFVREVTADRVKTHFGSYVKGRVDRYEAPNVRALNFVCYAALGGGGAASLRSDPLGKSYGSNLLRMEIDIPSDVLKRTARRVAPKELPEV